jgi:lysine 2,3-aminomutase
MRKRRVADGRQVSRELIDQGIDYIHHHPQINEVVLSGGDPLMRTDDRLAHILATLRRIPHVRLLRIHSRIPAVLPQRVTPALAEMLSGCHPLYLNIHFNHPAEITPEVMTACSLLADAGIALGSQTVLLKGVNDNPHVLRDLFEALLRIRVRPYYLHLLDRVPGTAHFRVPLETGIHLLGVLRGRLSGMGMPHLMVDLPGGGGKVALTEESIMGKGGRFWKIRNWNGDIYDYPVGE